MVSILIFTLVLILLASISLKSISSSEVRSDFRPGSHHLPYCLTLDEDMVEEYPEVSLAFSDAVLFINESVNHEVFEYLNPKGSGEIIPVLLWDPEDAGERVCCENPFAFTGTSPEGEPTAIYMVADHLKGMSYEKLLSAVAHELGHIMTLGHDDFTTSFMHVPIKDSFPEMTSRDVKRIKDIYGLS